MKPSQYGHGAPQVVNLTEAALINLVKEAVISIMVVNGLSKEKLLADFQAMLTKALKEIVPQVDPEENIFLNATEAAKFMKTTKTTICKYKKVIHNGEPVLKFGGLGRIKRISMAECRRVMAANIINVRTPSTKRKKKQ